VTLPEVIRRAAHDGRFFEELCAHPVETAAQLGYEVSVSSAKVLLGLADVPDAELPAALRQRLLG
jgi:hypothetical protein